MLKGFEREGYNNKEIPHSQRKASDPLKGCSCIELLYEKTKLSDTCFNRYKISKKG